jgi:DNA-binding transcriptional regulator of glucitol operon
MASTTRQPVSRTEARWTLLLRPRWLAWHAFVVVACVGMMFLGDWQLHRAESGNQLSWAYTFEWPLFAAFTVFFWIKSLRDEIREPGHATAAEPKPGAAAHGAAGAAVAVADSGSAALTEKSPAPAPAASTTTAAAGAAEAGQATRALQAASSAASWDATSWDATSWAPTGREADADEAGKPVDVARATPADGEAYVARLMAEVQRSGRGRGRN